MKNLVEKYTAEVAELNDEGVVTIEYVVLAGTIVGAIGVVFATGWATPLTNAVTTIIGKATAAA
jgi:hypothetical protein